jgi:hypothetical protein
VNGAIERSAAACRHNFNEIAHTTNTSQLREEQKMEEFFKKIFSLFYLRTRLNPESITRIAM